MVNMLVDAFESMENEPGAPTVAANIFAHRIYNRSRTINTAMGMNTVSFNASTDSYYIGNYDYNTFMWARRRKLGDYIDNLVIEVPKKNLNSSEVAMFELQIKKGYNKSVAETKS